jgi:phosphatidylinositol alpha-mannosyltransferase
MVLSFHPAPRDAAYEHVKLEPTWAGGNPVGRIFAAPALLNSADTSGLDVLHLHGSDWFFVRRGVPTLRTFYGSALWEARHAARLRRRLLQSVAFVLEIAAARLATASYTSSPGWERLYRSRGTLACGTDVPDAPPDGRSSHESILFVGTWHGRKRGRYLYDVFRREVLPRLGGARLWMVSDYCVEGPDVSWIRSPSDAELAALYAKAWVFCLPSLYEGFGIPYIEAMAAGTPVITSPNPGARHVLADGSAGLIVPDGELGDTLVRVLSDANLRSRLAVAGRARARSFSWDAVVDAHERAYREAIARWRQTHSSPRDRAR